MNLLGRLKRLARFRGEILAYRHTCQIRHILPPVKQDCRLIGTNILHSRFEGFLLPQTQNQCSFWVTLFCNRVALLLATMYAFRLRFC